MVFTNAGINRVVSLLSNDINYAVLGSGTTAAALTDVALESSIAGTDNTVTNTIGDKQIIVDYVLTSVEAVGDSVGEMGTFNASNTLLSRRVFSALTHSSTEQWQLSTRYWVD